MRLIRNIKPTNITLSVSTALALATSGRAQTLPGILSYSWIGNSFMDHTTKAWVPNEVRDLCVTCNGTVFTAGYSEAGMTRWCPSGDGPLPDSKLVSFEEVGFLSLFSKEWHAPTLATSVCRIMMMARRFGTRM